MRPKIALYVLLFLFLLSCSDGFPPEFPAADFTLKSPVTGDEISLETIKGKPVIIYWFASWWVRCAEEFPLLRQAREKHSGEGLEVYYIGHQDRVPNLVRYAKDNNLPDFFFDPDDSMSKNFGMTYGGGAVFINRDAIVKSRIPRGISPSMLEAEIQKIL